MHEREGNSAISAVHADMVQVYCRINIIKALISDEYIDI